jgi:hypothetical protein
VNETFDWGCGVGYRISNQASRLFVFSVDVTEDPVWRDLKNELGVVKGRFVVVGVVLGAAVVGLGMGVVWLCGKSSEYQRWGEMAERLWRLRDREQQPVTGLRSDPGAHFSDVAGPDPVA